VRWLFCWRCGCEMPMLDEGEFAVIAGLYHDGIRLAKQVEHQPPHLLRATPREERFKACLDAYERLTGFRESNPNAVMHHRLVLYGPPCLVCGKAASHSTGIAVHGVRGPKPCRTPRDITFAEPKLHQQLLAAGQAN
jgi:hypothetical protein